MAHRRLIIRDRITAIIGATLLCALVAGSYYYSIQTRIEGLKYVPSETSPDFQAVNVTLTNFDKNGIASERISAKQMDHFSDERMKAVGVKYYSLDPNKLQLSLHSDRAWSNDNLESVDLTGNVTVSREAGKNEPRLLFKTEYIKAYLDTSRLETSSPVLLKRGSDLFRAEGGLKYDNIAHQIELNDRVTSVFHPKK